MARSALVGTARALLSLRAIDLPPPDPTTPRIYVANHVSHADFVALWSVLPKPQRLRTRPVAGADYWRASGLKRWIADQVFRAVLIDRDPAKRQADPVETVADVLRGGEDVIFFPEGTRNLTDTRLLPLKSGIFHLAHAAPKAEIVPAWIMNLDRILPKGSFLPVPMNCAVRFGPPLRPGENEGRDDFLIRLAEAMLALSERS
jgi:1-acyl-sn-glycerol-3-phosphate acyltransferase